MTALRNIVHGWWLRRTCPHPDIGSSPSGRSITCLFCWKSWTRP